MEHGYPIPLSTIAAIQGARENGHLVFICTGRGAADVPVDVRAIGFDGEITNAGAVAVIGDKQVVSHAMSPQEAKFLVDTLGSWDLPVLVQTHRQTYATKRAKEIMARFEELTRSRRMAEVAAGSDVETSIPPSIGAEAQSFPEVEGVTFTDAAKVLYISERSDVDVDELRRTVGDRFHVVTGSIPVSAGSTAEISLAGVTKGHAIAEVLAHLGMQPAAAIGVGDSWNDVEMFDLVGEAVAMADAEDGVKSRANRVTTSVHDDGIHNAFAELGLI